MGVTIQDVESSLDEIARSAELGQRHCTASSIGQLAEVVAEVLSEGDIRSIRRSAARISAFLKAIVGITVLAGGETPSAIDATVKPDGEASFRPSGPDNWQELADGAKDRAIANTKAVRLAANPDGGDNYDDPTSAWRNEVAGPLTLLLRQLRHVALAQEAADLAGEQHRAALTVDDRVLVALRAPGPHRSGDIAVCLGIDRAQASRSLTRLVRSGSARESSSRTKDGRGRWYEPTDTDEHA